MAIKQRVLTKLNTIEQQVLRAMKNGNGSVLYSIIRDLEIARNLCCEGLPRNSYAPYWEIYDGMILAVRKMVADDTGSSQEEALVMCRELLQYILMQTEQEKNFKKELVFLPYKASMWDSLESVWKVAYEDKEHCNAYVVPIPYADLNPDGSVAEWHCERELFPRYVPTMDWQNIDLKAWHPDVIFIHNPYDDCNLVTSVESRFYSRNLRECTDKLVYIPYFVLEEPCSEEGVAHFALTPGVTNADKVIVQSEAVRDIYVNVLTERTNQKERAYWEKRISGEGSPKIDKVLNSKREDFEMPEKWRKLVEGKTVILYNTSLSAMLQNSDKVCDKLRYIFDIFRKRTDVVLWWRPHPLMKSTFHSMRPQFEEEYLSLEKQYIEEGWGIYDSSPDLHRAICWSNGYYGDSSSVVSLYKKSGKLVIIQELEQWKKLYFTGGTWLSDSLLFPAWNVNGLFCWDQTSHTAKLLYLLPADLVGRYLFCKLEKVGERLYFIPTNENFILILDEERDEWDKIYLDDEMLGDSRPRFTDVFRFGDIFWLKPYFSHAIVSYSIATREVRYYKEWFDEISYLISKYGDPLFGAGTKSEEEIYFPLVQANRVIAFNVKTYAYKILSIGNHEDRITGVAYHSRKLLCYTDCGDLLVYDLIFGSYERMSNILRRNVDMAVIVINDEVAWFFACKVDVYAKMNLRTHKVTVRENYLGGTEKIGYPNPCIRGDYIYLYPNQGEWGIRVNIITEDIETFQVAVPDEYGSLLEDCILEQLCNNDGKKSGVLMWQCSSKKDNNLSELCGSNIYQYVML